MTDHELLEAAARAVGMDFEWPDEELIVHRLTGQAWNPLTDRSDNLELLTALEIDILYRVVGSHRVECLAPGGTHCREFYKTAEERVIATMRAVVRAAAAKSSAWPRKQRDA